MNLDFLKPVLKDGVQEILEAGDPVLEEKYFEAMYQKVRERLTSELNEALSRMKRVTVHAIEIEREIVE